MRRIGYDGHDAFWGERAAGTVARAIADFVDDEGIGPGELVLVGHSMGGLVLRWIVNQGVPQAPYYDHRGAPYSRVVEVTRALVTIQTPHTGTEVADALFGEADTWYARRVADVVQLLGIDRGNEAARWMRRIEMEHASASGGWMGDAGRTVRLYTVAGFSTYEGSGTWARWMSEDSQLALVWGALCHRAHAIKAWACREDPGEAGDGLVEQWSAAGYAMRGGARGALAWEQGTPMQGARVDWLRIEHNHHQGGYDWLAAEIRDHGSGRTARGWLGSHIGERIRML